MTRARKNIGRITYLGAGPGDPGLLAVHAVEALQRAAIVYADADVPDAITLLSGGELRAPEATPADTAKAMAIEARNGGNVARVVAGDPFSVDAIVKEATAIAKTVVPFDVVPGVPVGSGATTYAGVPVGSTYTMADLRDLSSTDFETLAHSAGTLVVTIGAADVALLGEELVANGLKPDTPVTVSCDATGT